MLYLLNPRVIAVLVILAALAASHIFAYRKGSLHVRNEWAVATANANSEARRLEQARQRRADEAGVLAQARQARNLADAVRAADSSSGLRDELNAARLRSAQSLAAANQRADTLGELFLEGVEAYRELAKTCDRHLSDVRLLLDGWPK